MVEFAFISKVAKLELPLAANPKIIKMAAVTLGPVQKKWPFNVMVYGKTHILCVSLVRQSLRTLLTMKIILLLPDTFR